MPESKIEKGFNPKKSLLNDIKKIFRMQTANILTILRAKSVYKSGPSSTKLSDATTEAFYAAKLKKIDASYKVMTDSWKKYSKITITESVAKGINNARKFLRIAKKITPEGAFQAKTTKLLINQTIDDMVSGMKAGRRDISRLFKLSQQHAVKEEELTQAIIKGRVTGTPKAMKSELLKVLEKRVDKEGKIVTTNTVTGAKRRFSPETYAELVARTRNREAQSAGVLEEAKANDIDLVRISDHNTTTPICLPYEGQVFSLSGDSTEFDKLDATPPFHVNCLHVMTPFILSPENTERGKAQRESIEKAAKRNEAILEEIEAAK